MRILVFEYATGGGQPRTALSPTLSHEGDMMLAALVEDLCEIPSVQVLIGRDTRLPQVPHGCEVYAVSEEIELTVLLSKLCAEVDAVWPIAPETDGILELATTAIVDSGRILLNSRPEAVAIAASKRETAAHLARCGLPVVPAYEPDPALFEQHDTWVVKPDDGAGCSGARICRSVQDLLNKLDTKGDSPLIAQPHVQGIALSLSLLCRDGEVRLLSCNRQRVAVVDDTFHLLGCVANERDATSFVTDKLLENIGIAIPGLWGYVGIDVMLTNDGPLILEVNPRLTVSYIGLKHALGLNPAGLVLDLLDERNDFAPGLAAFDTSLQAVNVDLEVSCHA